MVQIQKLFCFNLFTAGLIIGWLGLAGSITSFVSYIVSIINFELVAPNGQNDEETRIIRSYLLTLLGLMIGSAIVDCLANGFLIAGTIKRNRLLLLPWLIKNGVTLLCVSLLFVFGSIALLIVQIEGVFFGLKLLLIIFFGIFWVISFYIFLAIYSLHAVIRNGTIEPKPYTMQS